jgi:uncharacterized protein YjbI with pentapeptide repeats
MAQKSSPPPLTPEDFSGIMAAHRQWEESGGQEGKKAEFSGANLQGLDLSGYNLSGLDFRGANLSRGRFGDTPVEGANFRSADLQEADLSGVRGLLAPQLAGADLAGAKLPEDLEEFTGVKHVDAASSHVQKIFFVLLLVCVYCWLTIAVTTDASLLNNFAEQPLPIIGTKISLVTFYWAAPFLLLCVFLYFHLCVQRLWEALAELPAVFPDGLPLPHRVHPWLWNGLIWAFFPRLRDRRPPLLGLQKILAFVLVWWAGPLTLLALWYRYLPVHDWTITIFHIVLLTLALDGALGFFLLTRATLRLKERKPFCGKKLWHAVHGLVLFMTTAFIAALFMFSSLIAIEGLGVLSGHKEPLEQQGPFKDFSEAVGSVVSEMMDFLIFGPLVKANLKEADVSLKLPQWKPGDLDQVRGAFLRGKNLRGAKADKAFLVKADLSKANLQYAHLDQANLQHANLEEANLEHAYLGRANLRYANLVMADLQHAELTTANLQHANLERAKLERADLVFANFQQANLSWASLCWANLQDARGLEKDQLLAATCWPLAKYDQKMLKSLQLPPEHNDNLIKKNLSGYQLPQAHFWKADFSEVNLNAANLQEADLRWTKLRQANLKEVNLQGAALFKANLQGATLQGANLEEADLFEADLTGVDLRGAILKGANLLGAKGLTREQLQSAIMDEHTKLPDEFKDMIPSETKKPQESK